MAKFSTKRGYQALITLTHHNEAVPFGSFVTVDSEGSNNSSIVGDGGQVYRNRGT
jgi:outer membrane usher protein